MKIEDILKKLDGKDLSKIFLLKILEIANLDSGRFKRIGKPEAVLAEFKSKDEIREIVKRCIEDDRPILLTRLREEHFEVLKDFDLRVNRKARTASYKRMGENAGKVAILAAGTSDIQVAEEAKETAEFLGLKTLTFYDIGIAGIHRMIEPLSKIREEDVDSIIAVAGMEGALPSVVAALVDIPVIAVPTSVGYGTHLGGFTALFSMLQSCSSGVAVVNIDNGFGAAVFAYLISRRVNRFR